MPEEFQQIKTELRTNAVPIVIGATAILLVAVGIYLFASRPQPKQQALPGQVVVETPFDLSHGQPQAVNPLSGLATPTPSPSPKSLPTPSVKPGTVTKGGQLPKSGFPAYGIALLSFGLLATGIKFLKR